MAAGSSVAEDMVNWLETDEDIKKVCIDVVILLS